MKEIQSNKEAWSKISEEHYNNFKSEFLNGNPQLNAYIQNEVGDITGKKVLHLQCNTGADSLVLARTAESVTGVDLVPENVYFAKKMATELGVTNTSFIESDLMKLSEIHDEKYDVIFTSEGVLGWLPDLNIWARTIRKLLNEDGYLYVFDTHPFSFTFDESKLSKDIYEIKYPYFSTAPDIDNTIGGYASEIKDGVETYFWNHTVSDIINSLIKAGLHIEFFNEYSENFFDIGGMQNSPKQGLFEYKHNVDKYPMSFSLKATIYPRK